MAIIMPLEYRKLARASYAYEVQLQPRILVTYYGGQQQLTTASSVTLWTETAVQGRENERSHVVVEKHSPFARDFRALNFTPGVWW